MPGHKSKHVAFLPPETTSHQTEYRPFKAWVLSLDRAVSQCCVRHQPLYPNGHKPTAADHWPAVGLSVSDDIILQVVTAEEDQDTFCALLSRDSTVRKAFASWTKLPLEDCCYDDVFKRLVFEQKLATTHRWYAVFEKVYTDNDSRKVSALAARYACGKGAVDGEKGQLLGFVGLAKTFGLCQIGFCLTSGSEARTAEVLNLALTYWKNMPRAICPDGVVEEEAFFPEDYEDGTPRCLVGYKVVEPLAKTVRRNLRGLGFRFISVATQGGVKYEYWTLDMDEFADTKTVLVTDRL
jgi:hypothetical protein